jgi:hypothetical protein
MLNLKELKVQYITDETGAKSAVVLSMDAFQALFGRYRRLGGSRRTAG